MNRHLLHTFLVVAFSMMVNTVFAQPANLPVWDSGRPEGDLGAPLLGDEANGVDVVNFALPAISIVDIDGTSPSLTLSPSNEAGSSLAEVTSNNSWLNYTSISETNSTYKITAAITGGTVPEGTVLKAVAASNVGSGNGAFGVPANQVTLVSFAQDFITGIGSSYTSNGVGNGHQLTYSWSVVPGNYSSLQASSGSDITVTYTITSEL